MPDSMTDQTTRINVKALIVAMKPKTGRTSIKAYANSNGIRPSLSGIVSLASVSPNTRGG